MKKFFLLLGILLNYFCATTNAQATLPAEEHFNYTTGELRTVGTNWSRISGTASDLNVIDGNLSYSGYPMAATGRQASINNGGADDLKFSFTPQSTSGTTVYASFLVNLTNTTGLGAGAYFAALGTGTSSYASRLFIKTGVLANTYNLGLARNSTTATFDVTDLNISTTYLIVISYSIVTGTTNDIAKLWINPSLAGSEPTADITVAGTTADLSIEGFFIRQASGTPTAQIDGIRIATSWDNAPLPVELSSFSALPKGNGVQLTWATATEINNFGFEVERSQKPVVSSENSTWQEIGFVKGNGNSNSPKEYSYTDNTLNNSGKYIYRLKQIDNDGTVTYSNEIETDVTVVLEYGLSQNYPNPFNPATVINYTLAEPGFVTIKVYNMLGEEVTTLINGQMEAGKHTLQFDGHNLSSGMYLYKITAGNFTQVKKMLLTK